MVSRGTIVASAILLMLSCSAAFGQECFLAPTGLASWWPGDGNASDLAGSAPGALVGGTSFVPSPLAQAFRFDGINDSVDFGPAIGKFGTSDFTILLRIRTTSLRSEGIIGKRPYCGYASFFDLRISGPPTSGLPYFETCGGSTATWNDVYPGSDGVINDGRWHCLGLAREGQKIAIYLDGSLVAVEPTASLTNISSAASLIAGRSTCTGVDGTQYFTGELDEIQIYNRALQLSEIQGVCGDAGVCKVPQVDAGADRTVDEGASVQLTGFATEPLGRPLAYAWTQIGGPSVVLNDSTVLEPTFAAPSVPAGGTVVTFQLVATSSLGSSEPSTVNITIKNINNRPVAETTGDQTVPEQSPATLDGNPSYDVDDEVVTYAWMQVSGTAVTLLNGTTATPSFSTPSVGPAGETLTFQLVVHDGIDSSAPALVNVNVTNINQIPTANAGADSSVPENTEVHLTGVGLDPDGDTLNYRWTQTGGTAVAIPDPTNATLTFWAPFVALGGEALTFALVVSDGVLDSSADEVSITVLNTNDPPSCATASATLSQVWPPNHKLIEVGVTGVVDPQGDPITVAVTSVTSDEATSGLGDGDTSPDAVVQGSSVLLRAERWDQGDGRVYTVHFSATDSNSESCVGKVKVGVAKSAKKGATAIESGQAYDATTP